MRSPRKTTKIDPVRSIKKPLGICVSVVLLVWLLFFDSHSLISRMQWYQEYRSLSAQNAELENDIAFLESELEKGLSDDAVEKIAREQFGMRRENETVFPVAPEDD